MRARKLICIGVIIPLMACRGGTVRMLTGESYEGKITVSADGMTITSQQGSAEKIDPGGLQDAAFQTIPSAWAEKIGPGVFLTDGSYVAGEISGGVRSLEEQAVRAGHAAYSIPGQAVAEVLFTVLRPEQLPHPAPGSTGAILQNGDFFAGTVTIIGKVNRVLVNSLLIGPQTLIPGPQAPGIVLRDIHQAAANYQVTTREDSQLLANDLRFDAGGVTLTEPVIGAVRIPSYDLMEIRAGAGRYLALAGLTPVRIDPQPGGTVAGAFKVQPADAADTAPDILTAPNATVSYAVPAGLTSFSCGAALADDSPASAHLAFDLYADGRLLPGTATIAAGANPQPIHFNLGAARVLTLRAEPVGPGSSAATARWMNPIFLRP
jgi:hypothetical protein